MQVTSVSRTETTKLKTLFILSVQIVLAPILFLVGYFVGWKLCHPKRYKVKGTPEEYSLPFQNVTFKSNDGKTRLNGWMMSTKNATGTIIFSHGYRGSRTKAPTHSLKLAKFYLENGYNVLMFDYRNAGESAGKLSTVGLMETEDLIGAIDYIKRNKKSKIVLIGWSTGGSSALMAAAKRSVDAIITDSAFHNLEAYLNENLAKWTKLPSFINPFIMFAFPLITKGKHPRMVKPIESLDKLHCPIYFIHNEKDSMIPHESAINMYKTYKGKKELWITSKGNHVTNHISNNDYLEKTNIFLDAILKEKVPLS